MRKDRARGYLATWDSNQPPKLDFHMHTTWTDGKDAPAAMLRAAQEYGLEAVLFSEHARAASASWFPAFAAQIRALPQSPCQVFVGAEVKILDEKGNLDATPDILEACDLVVGVVHSFPGERLPQASLSLSPKQTIQLEYRLACVLVETAGVDVLGHPFGMTVRRFGQRLPLDLLHDVARRAARAGVAMEFNAKYHGDARAVLDVYRSAGAMVSIGSDAHSAGEVGRAAQAVARERGLS